MILKHRGFNVRHEVNRKLCYRLFRFVINYPVWTFIIGIFGLLLIHPPPDLSQPTGLDYTAKSTVVRTRILDYTLEERQTVTFVIVACGQKRNVTTNALLFIKSAIVFGRDVHIRLIIFRDEHTDDGWSEKLEDKLQHFTRDATALGQSIRFEVRNATYPPDAGADWRNMYMTCVTQRLFLAELLPTTDAAIYLDADTIFLSNLKEIWAHFGRMDTEQLGGMINEGEPPAHGWYNTDAVIPYYGPRGVNGGVFFMNLTRMRQVHFVNKIKHLFGIYYRWTPFIDQDLLNIFFHKNPQLMYDLTCEYNFRHGHCRCYVPNTGSCNCVPAEQKGISITHGNLYGFEHLPLKVIHDHFENYNLVTDNPGTLLNRIRVDLIKLHNPRKHCVNSAISLKFLQKFEKYVNGDLTPEEEQQAMANANGSLDGHIPNIQYD